MTANYLSASAVNGGIRFAIGLSWIVQNPISIMEIEQSVALFFFPKPCFNTELCLYLLAILVLLLTIHLALNRVEVLLLVICINSLNERLALSQIDILKAGLLLRIARWLIFGNYRIVKTIVLLNSSRHIIRIKDRLKIVARFFHSNQLWLIFFLVLILLLLLMRLEYLFSQLRSLIIFNFFLILCLFLPLLVTPARRRLLRCLIS